MTLDTAKDLLKMLVPTAIAIWNFLRSAKRSDLQDVRRRLAVLERAFTDLFSLTQEFLDEVDVLVDGLPHGLRPPFRSHIALFRVTLGRMHERLHSDDDTTKEE